MQPEKKGLSLIEVVPAIAILMAILLSMTGIFSQGYRYLRKSRMQTVACALAQEKVEAQSVWPPSSSNEAYGTITGFLNFRRVCAVANDPTYPTSLRSITVTVFWQGEKGEQSLTLVSLVANF